MRFERNLCLLGVLVIGSLFCGNLYAADDHASPAQRVVHVEKRDFRYDNGRFAETPPTGTQFIFNADKLELVELQSVKSDVCTKNGCCDGKCCAKCKCDKCKCGCVNGGACSCCDTSCGQRAFRVFRRCR